MLMLVIRLCVGLAFFLLGALKLGVVVGFFPRHIFVGHVHSSINIMSFTFNADYSDALVALGRSSSRQGGLKFEFCGS